MSNMDEHATVAVCVCVCVWMYVCMYICPNKMSNMDAHAAVAVCTHVCMYGCMDVCNIHENPIKDKHTHKGIHIYIHAQHPCLWQLMPLATYQLYLRASKTYT